MKNLPVLLLGSILTLVGCTLDPTATGGSGQPGFRVRSDFSAGLNADRGWAGALNENVTVYADQPFRLRFEVERPPAPAGVEQFRLQYRRNGGEWLDVEAHDFPYPQRQLDLDFAQEALGASPAGWRVVQGQAAGLAVAAEGPRRVLRARADREPLISLYTPPWAMKEFAAAIRLPAESETGVGLVFGYVDADNYGRVLLDAAGAIRVSRFVDGVETAVTEKTVGIPLGAWLDIEIEIDDRKIDVDYGDGALTFTAPLGAAIPSSPLGFYVPAHGTAEFREFEIQGEPRTPRVSIVSCAAYEQGAATTNLLAGSAAAFQAGAGINLADRPPPWSGAGAQGEFEWALVVRRYADGPVANEEGDTFEFRMVGPDGATLNASPTPALRLAIPPGHVGGTFVETPGRIGPWQASNGDLYFIMEPTETNNVFMMVKSTDQGRTWQEVDGANRPRTNDLESVDARLVGDTVHILHQVTRSSRYHAFHTSDHPTRPDSWAVRDEVLASAVAVAQAATLAVRSDGSMVAFYVGPTQIHYNVRSPAGVWGTDTVLETGVVSPQAVLGANDVVHLAYYGTDGSIWYRRMRPDGTFSAKQRLATGVGTSRADYGAVLPLVFIPETNTVVILYRLASGRLWERRIVNDSPPTVAVQVTDREVVRHAVDSQQPAADVVLDGRTVRVLFIEQASRSLFSTDDSGDGRWQASRLRVDDIRGSWVRGNVYTRPDGVRVYAYIYDAGSEGGAGMNRFGEIVLSGATAGAPAK